jgi:hypothetical protein
MPKPIHGPIASAIGLLLAIRVLCGAALADAPTTVSTTLAVHASGPTVMVSADKFKDPVGRMALEVFLGSLPANADLQSCALRLVTASDVPKTQYNGVAVQLFDDATDLKSLRSIAARTIDAGTPAGSTVELRTAGLCRSLMDKIAEAQSKGVAKYRVQTTIAGAAIGFYGRAADFKSVEPALAPRLLLTYLLPNSWPGRADWSQPRRDAQQSGRSPWRIYNPQDFYLPRDFRARRVGTATFDEVSPPLLLYNRHLVAVSGGSNLQIMDAAGTRVRPEIELGLKPKFIGVSQEGWLYATGVDRKIVMQPLDGQGRFEIGIGPDETVLDPPTIGADGSLFFATNLYVYAYPAPPVAPNLANVPLWRFRTAGGSNDDVSAIALSEDERTAYFVDKPTGSLVALDAATGVAKWRRGGLNIDRPKNDPMPLPVVADRTVFVTDKAPTGSALYIVDGTTGDLLRTIKGNDIAAPVAGPDHSVFYSRDASHDPDPHQRNLRRLRRVGAGGKFEEVSADDGCPDIKADLLRTDLSGNVYLLDKNQKVFGFSPASGIHCGRYSRMNLASLIVAADGSIFGLDREQQLQAIAPELSETLALSNSQILKLNQDGTAVIENNDTTFRAAEVTNEPGLFLPVNTNINIVAGKRIAFRPGLRIESGARLHASVVGR